MRREMGIDFFAPLSVFYEYVPPFLTFPGLLFTRQVLVSHHKSNEELLKCTTGTDPCKDHQQPPSAFTSFREGERGRRIKECRRKIVNKNESNCQKSSFLNPAL